MIKADDQKHAVLRNAVAFLIFGLSNNLHVPLMISASEDIIKLQNDCHHRPQNIVGHTLAKNLTLNCLPELGKPRCERTMSTGAVLLADFLPSLTIKLTVAFFMNRIPYSFRHFLVCSLQATSFILVGISTSIQMSMLGVVFGSAGAGFAVYFLSYWTILIRPPQVHRAQLLKPSSWIVPAIKAGNQIDRCDDVTSDLKNAGGGTHEFTFVQKIKMIKPLLRYMIPICLVYIMDFLINSGLASPEFKEFSMSVISLGNTVGITMAGFLSILAHNHICHLYPTIFP
uniref:Battenin n=1 Tax=Globodera pallida TaxID=36090 RepID=A0A183BWU8_GLOPA